MMKFSRLTPMLWTNELEQTMNFYSSVLGFSINEFNKEWGWCSMSKDNVDLMLAKPNEHTPFNGPLFTGSFYFHTEDVDELWETLKDSSYVFYPIENFEYGMREFAIKDNNGYILQFGKEIIVQ